ncbi:dihydrofolate reductase [Nocardioides sp. zg-1308]|uniref:dihydrofolate reductase family protein n=1 Tax=Nocardioides TaxID=1839 RepID=UPI00155614B4|nr:dihydrofolate reductase family protein [Nocardioides sp. S-34]NPD04152.1 dihydrofolate reductase [Nocardioides sp. zg-1308]WQQ22037.1 dihydrofolate reductase family protein [Nocardioides sp. S-34]
MTKTWEGLVFIGTSVDGQVARADGSLDWLVTRGEAAGDAGYAAFMERVDVILMGRATYEVARGFDPWPYAETPVVVLSTTLAAGQDDRVRVVRSLDEASDLFDGMRAGGVYVDGASTVRSCLAAGLVDELTISQVPVLIGAGIPLFGSLPHDIDLSVERSAVLGGGMVQTTYRVHHG